MRGVNVLVLRERANVRGGESFHAGWLHWFCCNQKQTALKKSLIIYNLKCSLFCKTFNYYVFNNVTTENYVL